MKTIALIAHDKKKSEMLEFVGHHKELLSKFHLIATRTTGTLINDTFGLGVETMDDTRHGLRPASLRPSKACGLVTSCTR